MFLARLVCIDLTLFCFHGVPELTTPHPPPGCHCGVTELVCLCLCLCLSSHWLGDLPPFVSVFLCPAQVARPGQASPASQLPGVGDYLPNIEHSPVVSPRCGYLKFKSSPDRPGSCYQPALNVQCAMSVRVSLTHE